MTVTTHTAAQRRSARFRVRLVAIVFVSLALSSVATSSHATVVDPCARAGELVASDPQAALDLIAAYRAPAIELLNAGVESRGVREVAEGCEPERQSALVELNNPEQKAPATWVAENWNQFVAAWVTPLVMPTLAALGIFVAILIVGRLFVLLPGSPWVQLSTVRHRVLGAASVVLAALVSVFAVVFLALTGHESVAHLPNLGLTTLLAAVLALLIALSLLAALGIAAYLAGRLRLRVTVLDPEGKSNPAQAAQVVAHLAEFGGTSPDSFSLPPDGATEGLKDLVPDVVGTKVITSVISAIQVIFGLVPWAVNIARIDEARVSVIVRRNGRTDSAVMIDLTEFAGLAIKPSAPPSRRRAAQSTPPTDALPDPRPRYGQKFAAAVFLSSLAKAHPDFSGMFGATEWRSIGLYFVAKTDFAKDEQVALDLLALAIEIEPGNSLAKLAFSSMRDRQATALEQLIEYSKASKRLIDDPELVIVTTTDSSDTVLAVDKPERVKTRLRVLTMDAFVARNLTAAATVPDFQRADLRVAVASAMRSAIETVHLLHGPVVPADTFSLRMKMTTAINVRVINLVAGVAEFDDDDDIVRLRSNLDGVSTKSSGWFDDARNSLSPEIGYSMLCLWARSNETGVPDIQKQRTMRLALRTGGTREWIGRDPELAAVNTAPWFVDALDEP